MYRAVSQMVSEGVARDGEQEKKKKPNFYLFLLLTQCKRSYCAKDAPYPWPSHSQKGDLKTDRNLCAKG